MTKLNLQHLKTISDSWIKEQEHSANFCWQKLLKMKKEPNNFVGWMDLPSKTTKKFLDDITSTAKDWQSKYNTVVVVGIGGSYLGARAAIDFIQGIVPGNSKMEIIYLGNSMSSTYIMQTLKYLRNKNFCVNVISKSGTTLEPSLSFHLLVDLIKELFGKDEISKRIIATTDAKSGVLFSIAKEYKLKKYIIPNETGGRFSVLTPVGLLPMALCGINIHEVVKGAKECQAKINKASYLDNDAMKYAVVRNLLLKQGFNIEVFASFEMQINYFNEWLKQLFGESEGKNGVCLFPASLIYSTDLHSLGQMMQSGQMNLFETMIKVKQPVENMTFKSWSNDIDKLNFLNNKNINYINYVAYESTLQAHKNEGNRNILEFEVDKLDEYNFGYLVQFFFNACSLSALLLGVNPFDQPGVEIYKKNMHNILKK